MIPDTLFRKAFLMMISFTAILLLIFMLISTQYLTITSNALYKDVRGHALTTYMPLVKNITLNITKIKKITPGPLHERKLQQINITDINRNITPVYIKNYKSCLKFQINKPDVCKSARHSVCLIVISGIGHRSTRNAIRATWGGHSSEIGIPVIFFLGGTLSDYQQQLIEKESALFNDIVQENCIDTYRNMTLKTVNLMKWVADYCTNVRYILKTDDDMIINVGRLLKFINATHSHRTIYGKLARYWKPHRNPTSKWYVPETEYSGKVFPPFTTGPAYLFTSDSAKILYETSLETKFLFLEDVFMTGIVADKAGIKRKSNREFQNFPQRAAYKSYSNLISSHGHTTRDMYHLWFKYH